MSPSPRSVSAVVGAVCLLLTPHCTSNDVAPDAERSAGVTLASASWSLTWDRARVSEHPSGGWSVVTDLGYAVHVTRGWVVDQSFAFGPCVVPDAGARRVPTLAVRAAHAHGEDDPSTLTVFAVEDLVALADTDPFPALFAPTKYCRAHWLVARAIESPATHLRREALGSSLHVDGAWSRGAEAGEVHIDTWWTHGRLVDLAATTVGGLPSDDVARAARVTVTRNAGAMFDGIDFAQANHREVAWGVLDRLTETATVSVTLREQVGASWPERP